MINRHLYFHFHESRDLLSFILEFEEYEFQSDNLLKYLRRITFNIALSSSVDNPNGIYEYDIDSETIKIKNNYLNSFSEPMAFPRFKTRFLNSVIF
jgi:hypothetical protein